MDEQFPGASQRGLVATFAEKGARRRNNIIYNSGAQLLVKFWWPGRRWEAFWVRALLSTSLETPGGGTRCRTGLIWRGAEGMMPTRKVTFELVCVVFIGHFSVEGVWDGRFSVKRFLGGRFSV